MRGGNEFLHHHVEHGACCKGQHEGHGWHHGLEHQHDEKAEDWLDDSREGAEEEGAHSAHALSCKRKRDGGAFGNVLDADAERKRECRGERGGLAREGGGARDEAHRTAFRHVVQRDRNEEQHRSVHRGLRPLGPGGAWVQVRKRRVEELQEERARRHARTRRKPWRAALCLRHLLRGNDQAPD